MNYHLTKAQQLIKDQTVFIIGGGSSLSNFDFTKLNGKSVIAINSAYRYVDNNAILYWMDQTWARQQKNELINHPSILRFTSFSTIVPYPQVGKAYPLLKTGEFGYDSDIGQVKGNNSGSQAINFAATFNPKQIVLLGFDGGPINDKTHFHSHQLPVDHKHYVRYNQSLESLANLIPCPIINCSNQTNLTCFQIGDINDYL